MSCSRAALNSPRAAASCARLERSSAGLGADGRGLRAARALLLQRQPEPVVALAQLRLDLDRLLECRDGAGEVAALTQRLSELVLNTRVRRIARGDAPQVLQRAFRIAFLTQREPQVHVRGQAVGLQRQRLLEHHRRPGKVAAPDQRGAQIGIGAPVFRIQGDRFPERRDGAGKIGLFREGDAEPVVRLSGPRSGLHGAAERRQRARVVVALPIRQAQRDMKLGVGGLALDRRLELAHGRLRLWRLWPFWEWEVDSNVSSSAPARAATTSCKAALNKTNTRRNVVCLRVIGRAPGVEAAGARWLRLPSAATSPARAVVRLFLLAHARQEQTQLVVRLHGFRGQLNRFPHAGFPPRHNARAHQQSAQRLERRRVIGIALKQSLQDTRWPRRPDPDPWRPGPGNSGTPADPAANGCSRANARRPRRRRPWI